jgi:DNA polymerase-3 subunit beta
MQNQFTISINALKGLDLLAGKSDIRYYLNGVNVEFSESCTRLVATNGHILGVENLTQNLVNTGAGSLIIPSDIIKALKPVGKNADIVQIKEISNPYGSCGKYWEIDNYGVKTTFAGIEGKFPDYARVISGAKTTGQAAQYNPDYLATFLKAAKLLTGAKTPEIEIMQNGHSAALINIVGLASFIGVIMPTKGKTGDEQAGGLANPKLYAPLVAAAGEPVAAAGEPVAA